jgi:hypothetical protein
MSPFDPNQYDFASVGVGMSTSHERDNNRSNSTVCVWLSRENRNIITVMKTRKSTMRLCKVAALALIVVAPMSASFARAASECSTLIALADWGENSTAYIDLKSGESCLFHITKHGTVINSEISQKPERGKLKRLNISTFQYTAKARAKGSDTFAIKATGQGPRASGTSVITVNATIK